MTAESCWDLQGLEGSCRHGACPQRVRDLNLLVHKGPQGPGHRAVTQASVTRWPTTGPRHNPRACVCFPGESEPQRDPHPGNPEGRHGEEPPTCLLSPTRGLHGPPGPDPHPETAD